MPGAQCTRSPVRAGVVKYAHECSQRRHRNHPAFPHAMVLTVSFVLSPVTGLFCHRRLRTNVLSAPGWADSNIRELDASVGASGPHDFTVRSNIVRQLAV